MKLEHPWSEICNFDMILLKLADAPIDTGALVIIVNWWMLFSTLERILVPSTST